MDSILQALIMGIVQGLTEFLPISSSGHLIIVPYLFGWDDPFITSLAFSVVLHAGTLAALLVYFRDDWRRLVPAGLRGPPRPLVPGATRTVGWPGCSPPPPCPAAVVALLFNDFIEENVRQVGPGRARCWSWARVILWLADRWGPRTHVIHGLTFRGRDRASAAPRPSPCSRASAGPGSACPPACSRAWTAPTPRGSAS